LQNVAIISDNPVTSAMQKPELEYNPMDELLIREVVDDVEENADLDLIKIQRYFGERPIFEFFPPTTSFPECSYWRYCFAGERSYSVVKDWIPNRIVNFKRNYHLNFFEYFMTPVGAQYLQRLMYLGHRNLLIDHWMVMRCC